MLRMKQKLKKSNHAQLDIVNYLVLVLLAFLMAACSPKIFRDLKSARETFKKGQTQLFKPGLKESLVYKTSIRYKEREFSALTYFNTLNDSVFKIVLLASFGNTLLEAEISRESFKVNNVISYLDRKPILKLFEKDWRLMLAGNFSRDMPLLAADSPKEIIFDYQRNRINNLYHYDLDKKTVVRIESFKGKKRNAIVVLDSFQDSQPANFSIEHPSLHLKLTMSMLKKVSNETIE